MLRFKTVELPFAGDGIAVEQHDELVGRLVFFSCRRNLQRRSRIFGLPGLGRICKPR